MKCAQFIPMPLTLPLTQQDLTFINKNLSQLPPQEILAWAIKNLPNLYQTTAFGLTGLVIIDMLSRISQSPPPLIFIDTLYHFNETLDLVERVKTRYAVPLRIYKAKDCESTQDFEDKYGKFFWIKDEDRYDYLVKASATSIDLCFK